MLVRAYAASSLPILVKALVGIFLLRTFADYLGKDGLGRVSQFQGIALLIYAFLNANFYNHIVQNNWGSNQSGIQFRRLLGIITLVCLILGLLLALCAKSISQLSLGDNSAVNAIYLLAIVCPFTGVFIAYSAHVCNNNRLIAFNVLNAIALLLSSSLIYAWVVRIVEQGAFMGFALYFIFPALLVAPMLLLNRENYSNFLPLFSGLKSYPYKSILKVGFVGIFSTLNAIGIQLFLRNELSASEGWSMVGDWQALTKISESYLLLVTTPLSTYFLPQISKIKIFSEQNKLLNKTLLMGVSITVMCGLTIYALWDLVLLKIIGLSFSPLKSLIPLQIFGDIFKVITWTFALSSIARMRLRTVLYSEIIFTLLYVILVKTLIPLQGLHGAIYAYVFSYIGTALFFLVWNIKEFNE